MFIGINAYGCMNAHDCINACDYIYAYAHAYAYGYREPLKSYSSLRSRDLKSIALTGQSATLGAERAIFQGALKLIGYS